MKTFLTADWHIGEERFELMQRPFRTVAEYIDALVAHHNAAVAPDDAAGDAGTSVRSTLLPCEWPDTAAT